MGTSEAGGTSTKRGSKFTYQLSSQSPSQCLFDVTMLVFVVNPSTAGVSN